MGSGKGEKWYERQMGVLRGEEQLWAETFKNGNKKGAVDFLPMLQEERPLTGE